MPISTPQGKQAIHIQSMINNEAFTSKKSKTIAKVFFWHRVRNTVGNVAES
jgi:hypothetical protein